MENVRFPEQPRQEGLSGRHFMPAVINSFGLHRFTATRNDGAARTPACNAGPHLSGGNLLRDSLTLVLLWNAFVFEKESEESIRNPSTQLWASDFCIW